MKTFLKIKCLISLTIIMYLPFNASIINADSEIKLFSVKKSFLEDVQSIRNYLNTNISGTVIQNYNIESKTNFYILNSEGERIKVYPKSGMIDFSFKGQKFKTYPHQNISFSQDDVTRIARQFLENNLILRLSEYDEIIVDGFQQVKSKATEIGSGREYISFGNIIVIFRRKINGFRVLGDGNFVKIVINPDMQVIAFEYQWDEIELIGQTPIYSNEIINRQYSFKDSEFIYICSDRNSANREIIPAYIGQSLVTSQIEIRNAISGNLINPIRIE